MELIKELLSSGGKLSPLVVDKSTMKGVSLLNPSVAIINGRTIVNIRNCNYTLWHTDLQQPFESLWGPLVYLNPENDMKLKTYNILMELDDDLNEIVGSVNMIDMKLDSETPLWEFHGLEDARLVFWNNDLYLCGVRRDVKDNGEGRMELSRIELINNKPVETKRYRIPVPQGSAESYCEKNWMPVESMPFHFVKWSDPTELVKYDINTKITTTLELKNQNLKPHADFRGSSQVVSFKSFRIAIVHETFLFKDERGLKNAVYKHRFVVWDKNWNIQHLSNSFSFLGFDIEFCCGLCLKEFDDHEEFIITFSCQDNTAFIMSIDANLLMNKITTEWKEQLY